MCRITMQHDSVIISADQTVRFLLPFSDSEIRALFCAMLTVEKLHNAFVELSLPRDAAMARLNKEAMGCPEPTNVLSFPAPSSAWEQGPKLLGWMSLAPQTMRREARLYGQPPAQYTVRLFAHGLAHLLGHDHGLAMDTLCTALEEAAHTALC